MNSYDSPDTMTETEIREEIAQLRELANEGSLTPLSARRLNDLKSALNEIVMAKKGKRRLWA